MAIKQSSLAQIARGRPQRYRSFTARPREINTGSQKDMQGREGGGRAEPRPTAVGGWKNPVRLYLGTVRVLFRAAPN